MKIITKLHLLAYILCGSLMLMIYEISPWIVLKQLHRNKSNWQNTLFESYEFALILSNIKIQVFSKTGRNFNRMESLTASLCMLTGSGFGKGDH